MRERPSLFSNIIAGIDFSEVGSLALDAALRLAAERGTTRLHVVHVAGPAGEDVELDLPDGARIFSVKSAVAWLEQHVERARVDAMRHGEPIEADRVSVHVRVGDADEELIALAKTLAADLLVVGTHGRSGFKRMVLGSVAESLVRVAPCSVLVIRPSAKPERAEAS